MDFENVKQIILDGQRTIGLKTSDVEALGEKMQSSSSFEAPNIEIKTDENGGVTLEDHTINTSVVGGDGVQSVPSATEVQPQVMPEVANAVEPNVFDNPSVEQVPQIQSMSVPEVSTTNMYDSPSPSVQPSVMPAQMSEANVFDVPTQVPVQPQVQQLQPEVSMSSVNSENVFDAPTEYQQLAQNVPDYGNTGLNMQEQPVMQQVDSYVAPVYAQPEVSTMPQEIATEQIQSGSSFVPGVADFSMSLDTPQTFYERQSDDVQGGVVNTQEVANSVQNVDNDPVKLMLKEIGNQYDRVNIKFMDLVDKNDELARQNAGLVQQIENLNAQLVNSENLRRMAEARAVAAEQTLANARMADSQRGVGNQGPTLTYQQPVQPQVQQYYQQAA